MPMPAFNDYPNDYLESHKIKVVPPPQKKT